MLSLQHSLGITYNRFPHTQCLLFSHDFKRETGTIAHPISPAIQCLFTWKQMPAKLMAFIPKSMKQGSEAFKGQRLEWECSSRRSYLAMQNILRGNPDSMNVLTLVITVHKLSHSLVPIVHNR